MILETGDLVSYPIIMLNALLRDMGSDEVWVELHLWDGPENTIKREGWLQDSDDTEVRIQDEAGDQPWGETHLWDDVVKVVVP